MSVPGTPGIARRGTVASISSQITNKRATQTQSASAVEESLRTFKLLEALRAGDHAALATLIPASHHPVPSSSTSTSRPASPTPADPSRAQSTPLHLAVQCASASTVEFLLSLDALDVNQRDATGNTALHLAAKSNRTDVVRLLINDENVNDALTNNDGKRAAELCLRGGEVEKMLEEHRAAFISSHTPLLHTYAAQSNLAALEKLFADPRTAALISINHQDPATGATILHEAARARDLDLVQWCLDRGADVLIRDRKGKLPAEVSKDERIKLLLKEALNGDTEEAYRAKRRWTRVLPALQSRGTIITTGAGMPRRLLNAAPTSVLIPAAPGTAPTMQGYLSKWTNYAGGFKSRWFVLDEQGMLAYYKNQDDANNACRGSINMKYAKIWIDAADKNRFDVIGKGTNRYHLKTEHPVEAKRWIFALSQSKQWIIDIEKGLVNPSKGRSSIILDDSHRPQFLTDEDNGSNISADAKPLGAGRRRASSKVSMTDSIVAARNGTAGRPGGQSNLEPLRNSEDDEDELFESQTEPPLGDEYRTNVNLVQKQVDLQEQLLESLLILTGDGSSSSGQAVAHATKQVMLVDAFRTSLKSLRGLVDEVLDMSEDRETFWRRKFEAEAERRRLWEESMHSLALEQQEMERFVQVVVQERKARRKEKRKKTAEVERGMMGGGESEIVIMEEQQEAAQKNKNAEPIPQHEVEDEVEDEFGGETEVEGKDKGKAILTDEPETTVTIEEKRIVENKKKSMDERKKAEELALDDDDLDEEEFFDAISDDEEGPAVPDMSLLSSIAATTTILPAPGTLPDSASIGDNTSVEDTSTDSGAPSEINTIATTIQPAPLSTTTSTSQLVPELQFSATGYPKELRTSLPIADNEKPTVSLWSILKNSIGKDLTRITLPVYFNEPTSMLQRMCEDVEYSELLDTAAQEPNSAERMMYVVAFAVSNFSSVPGRVAKPFNPLLGETFEYVRKDKGFRYISEQVCHHPPISACHCESPNYKFYAESDIKNKFWGRSFELHPKGVSHVELKVPNSAIPGAKDLDGRTIEHYSYKKPIVAVTNLITGNPTFEMYGDMEFSNHRTRDSCVLTFKARGWRSKDANEFRGFVTSGETGEKVWEIAGRWNERMLARRVKPIGSGGSTSALEEDLGSDNAAAAARPQHEGGSAQQKGRNIILLWKRHPFPETKVPYNLTDFAMTLNHLPDSLPPYIAPTDSRLRPDQRAMEIGEYDIASNEKTRLEEKQRAKRKARETRDGQHAEWQPRWFRRTIERDTQEGVWEFNDEYWEERERVRKMREDTEDKAAVKWNIDDDDIF